jgi:hypothetical protein
MTSSSSSVLFSTITVIIRDRLLSSVKERKKSLFLVQALVGAEFRNEESVDIDVSPIIHALTHSLTHLFAHCSSETDNNKKKKKKKKVLWWVWMGRWKGGKGRLDGCFCVLTLVLN